ncbi:hypothetical protein Aut01nite_34600 [Actinoplanes utahensis]|nr:hypothetical protein Aut01nite_34600 [Actinoplanes utahensis]
MAGAIRQNERTHQQRVMIVAQILAHLASPPPGPASATQLTGIQATVWGPCRLMIVTLLVVKRSPSQPTPTAGLTAGFTPCLLHPGTTHRALTRAGCP